MAAMPHFRDYYHTDTSGGRWGLIIAIYSIGGIFAATLLWTGDVIGRRGIAFTGCIVLTIGCVIQASAPNTSALIAGRFVAGTGAGLCATIGPAYMAEVAPSVYRGLAVGMYCSFYQIGAIMMAAIAFGCTYIDSNWQFRVPMIFQVGPPILVSSSESCHCLQQRCLGLTEPWSRLPFSSILARPNHHDGSSPMARSRRLVRSLLSTRPPQRISTTSS